MLMIAKLPNEISPSCRIKLNSIFDAIVVLAGFLFLGEWYPSIKKAHKLKSPKPML